ncbi:hypothetical protein [Sulfoacidibacillus thermotolerans]|uniref:Uncharacterized protein n=1 Tax=Sulfoacidibacillus thermotolerans TaxID=1765684 RepID=A0A2U3DC39_SULT2|nr:hypothetical protein [Sulfoacidibacillus thermotolerans]PWI58836.1 hypothetical protein BM613_01725 [Sulfoacidibacillus thermotolerans]
MRINLLPPPPPALRRRVLLFWIVFAILFIFALESGITYDTTILSIRTLTAEYIAAQSTLRPLSQSVAVAQKLQAKEQFVEQVKTLDATLPLPEEAISELQNDLPASCELGSIADVSGRITAIAYLYTYQEAATFLTALYHNPVFQDVQVSTVTDPYSSNPSALSTAGTTLGMSTSTTNAHHVPQTTGASLSSKNSPVVESPSSLHHTVTATESSLESLLAAFFHSQQVSETRDISSTMTSHPPVEVTLSLQVNEQELRAQMANR